MKIFQKEGKRHICLGLTLFTKVRSKYPRPRRQNVSKGVRKIEERFELGMGILCSSSDSVLQSVLELRLGNWHWLDWQRTGCWQLAETRDILGKN